ncbi:MAG: hypothetical protein EBT38_00470 [Acidimicrobiia bacterium]|nr:hypothetical protein [Acidimicrobiia bacterium]NBX12339.1 hypothetical protein [Acidimicrobiia bacterium]NDF68010.1 hypothetical protein [Actinomycetota bacterium]
MNINLTGFRDQMQVPLVDRRASREIITPCMRLIELAAVTGDRIDNLSDFSCHPHLRISMTSLAACEGIREKPDKYEVNEHFRCGYQAIR